MGRLESGHRPSGPEIFIDRPPEGLVPRSSLRQPAAQHVRGYVESAASIGFLVMLTATALQVITYASQSPPIGDKVYFGKSRRPISTDKAYEDDDVFDQRLTAARCSPAVKKKNAGGRHVLRFAQQTGRLQDLPAERPPRQLGMPAARRVEHAAVDLMGSECRPRAAPSVGRC